MANLVTVTKDNSIWSIGINRPSVKNCVDQPTAAALVEAFLDFEMESSARVAILYGVGNCFCSGADLGAMTSLRARVPDAGSLPPENRANPLGPVEATAIAPMGVTRLRLSKPVIAAIEGFAVAGGLELALWADLRVAAQDAVFGVFCRRWGVPLIDGGTVRLTRAIGLSRSMDIILTGREVSATEALSIGLANRLCPSGTARSVAYDLASTLLSVPFHTMIRDRSGVLSAFDAPMGDMQLPLPPIPNQNGLPWIRADGAVGSSAAAVRCFSCGRLTAFLAEVKLTSPNATRTSECAVCCGSALAAEFTRGSAVVAASDFTEGPARFLLSKRARL